MISIPEDDVLTLEQVKNQITMGEGEVKRLKGLRDDLEGQVHELVKAKKWNEDEIERTGRELDEARGVLKDLQDQVTEAEQTVAEYESVKKAQAEAWDKIEAAKQTAEHEKVDHQEQMSREADAANERQLQLDKLSSDLDDREQRVSQREKRLTSIADELRG